MIPSNDNDDAEIEMPEPETIATQEPPKVVRKPSGLFALEPWRNQPCTCVHCGKVLKNYAAKNSHLQHCRKRLLNRYLKVSNFLFVLRWNPLKRRALALQKVINDYPQSELLPKLILGACMYLKNSGTLDAYSVIDLEKSQDLIDYPDGWVKYPVLKEKMHEEELVKFELGAQSLANAPKGS